MLSLAISVRDVMRIDTDEPRAFFALTCALQFPSGHASSIPRSSRSPEINNFHFARIPIDIPNRIGYS